MDFIDKKQQKERGYSVKQAISDLNEKADEYEEVVIVGISKEGALDIGYSGDSDAKLIGILEVVKAELVDGIRERE